MPEGGEELRSQQQLLLHRHRALHRRAQPLGATEVVHRRVEHAEQAIVPDIADDHPAAVGEQVHDLRQHVAQVVGAREVLHHRVDDDGVETAAGQAGYVVRRPTGQPHVFPPTCAGEIPEPVDRDL